MAEERMLDQDLINDPVFQEEQAHLSTTYAKLEELAEDLVAKMEAARQAAAADKRALVEEISQNFNGYSEALETYVDFATVNSVIDAYNAAQGVSAEKLAATRVLLKQPYFAKVALQFKPGEAPKELYIGSAGISDENYKRLVVDWRSPVAEVYYNQENGRTSYHANGRDISVELKLRRQFDIAGPELRSYFDTTVAIQDPLLLRSLTSRKSAQMQAITATIQKEQNLVVRHEDVDVLLVNGIAGSGKTSVLLQRIAYLFYQQRETLAPEDVFLITPNPVFAHYIENVLPDLGERNPETLTWDAFAAEHLPESRGHKKVNTPIENLWAIDEACKKLTFEQGDFRDIRFAGEKLLSANQVAQVAARFKKIPAGPHLAALMREELAVRLENRLRQMAGSEVLQDEVSALDPEEQLRIFGEPVVILAEEDAREYATRYIDYKFKGAFACIERDEWLRIDRIGARLMDVQNLQAIEWLYLKMAISGMGNPYAKYVMIDEVQDYTPAQLAVFARYYRRAHFLLLGDENQAITPEASTFAQVRAVFEHVRGAVEECRLLTSYRSSPEITGLFAALMHEDERVRISSVQRPETKPSFVECETEEAYVEALRQAVRAARAEEGTTALIVPWKSAARRMQALLGEDAPQLIDAHATLPDSGVVLITLGLAKGLEFDGVIVADASERAFPDDALSRRRLYTTISRATRKVTLVSLGRVTPLLAQ